MSAIVINDLTKGKGKDKVLQKLNLEILDGEFFSLLGTEKSGKTTLARIIMGFLKPNSGSIKDYDMDSFKETKKIKENTSEKFLSVTPAIRLENDIASDQKRIATPQKAKKNGSDFIVVGRSITKSKNPYQTYKKIKEIFTRKKY